MVVVGNTVFASRSTDNELIDYEAMHPHAWKIILTLGTWVMHLSKTHAFLYMKYHTSVVRGKVWIIYESFGGMTAVV